MKFKCGAIESENNIKAFVDVGGKFNAGCLLNKTLGVYFPNAWHNDTMVHLGDSDFQYRECWGSLNGQDFDKTAVTGNHIYLQNDKINAITNGMASGVLRRVHG